MASEAKSEQADLKEFREDYLSDPTFVACRDENCMREPLHRAHAEPKSRSGRFAHEKYDKCPKCQTPVLVTKSQRKRSLSGRKFKTTISALCPSCGWAHSKSKGPKVDA